MIEAPDFIEPEDWEVVLETLRKLNHGYTLFAHNDELFLVTWDFRLEWWDPVDGCFMPTEKLY